MISIETTGSDPTVSVLIYGTNKIGKTSFAKDAPAPIFYDSENSTREIKGAQRFARLDGANWTHLLACVDYLITEKHQFKSLAIDTFDWLEQLAWGELLRRKPSVANGRNVVQCTTIDDYPFFSGYTMVIDVWRELLFKLERLRSTRGMNIIGTAHAAVRMVENPSGENYEQWDLKLNKHLAGVLREWFDAILFAEYRTVVRKKSNFDRGKGVDHEGARVLRTEERLSHRAGNRYSLPYTMDLSWDTFYAHARGTETESIEEVTARILERFTGSELEDKARKGIAKFADVAKLRRFENHLISQLPQAKETEE